MNNDIVEYEDVCGLSNELGGLVVRAANLGYYWRLEGANDSPWQPIPKALYDALLLQADATGTLHERAPTVDPYEFATNVATDPYREILHYAVRLGLLTLDPASSCVIYRHNGKTYPTHVSST